MQKPGKGDLEKHLECAAHKCWSKYTTRTFSIKTVLEEETFTIEFGDSQGRFLHYWFAQFANR